MSNDRPDEPFLSRWSRQKRQAVETATEAAAPEAAAVEPEVDLSKLPSIDDLTADSDITGFLQKGVPEALQQLALRRMWSLDPAIRDFIEVAENQWDFNAVGGVPGLFQEIAPGTDVSVWLAQATQSVAPGKIVAPASRAADGGAAVVAPQQRMDNDENADSRSVSDVQGRRSNAPRSSAVIDEPAESVEEPAKVADECAGEGPLQRRRHGGALPR